MESVADATSEAQLEAFRAKRVPEVEEVAPGVWSLPLPLVQLPIRYVLTYMLETPDGPVLVDCGWPDGTSWDAMERGLGVAGYAVADVHGVILTHAHPDHHGQVQRIRATSTAWVAGHARDVPPAPRPAASIEAEQFALLTRAGMPSVPARERARQFADGQQIEEIRGPQPDILLGDGDVAPVGGHDVVAVWTPGHTSGHLCLWLRNTRRLLTGDHVLPRISPSVGLNRDRGGDPLGDFLASLRRVAELPVDEVLPAHEYRFGGLQRRVEQLLRHHDARLDEVRGVLDDGVPRTAWEIAQRLTWSRPWAEIREWMQRAALFETLAHATVLQLRNEVQVSGDEVALWSAVAR